MIGGNRLYLGFGAISDQGVNFSPLGGPLYSDFQAVNRLPDHKPPDSGQYGANVKFYLPNLGQGTQVGLYFLNYTSRLPVLSANTGTQAGLGNAFGAINAIGGAAQALAAGLPFAAAVATGAAVGQSRAAATGGNLSLLTATQYATIGANTLLAGGNVNAQAQNIGTYEYGKTAGYFEEFPQDIKMIGASFNGEIKATGTAIQGEVAFRHNVPLQLDDVELLYAALTPFEAGIASLLSNGAVVPHPGTCPKNSPTPISDCNQLGVFGLGHTIRGWELKNTWQAGFTATQTFANVLKASQAVLVAEAAADYVPGLENKYSGGPARLRPALRRSGHEPERQSESGWLSGISGGQRPVRNPRLPVPGTRLGISGQILMGLCDRRAARVREPHRRMGHPAARHLVARCARRLARSGRQLCPGPARGHRRRRRGSAEDLGPGCFLHALWRRRSIQPAQRPQLRRGEHQVLVLRGLQ